MSATPKRLLFIGDGGPSPCFDKLCAEKSITVDYQVRMASIKLSPFKRHGIYLLLALRATLWRKKYDAVFIWQQYVGIYTFILSQFFPFFSRPTFVYYIIFNSKGGGIVSWLKRQLMLGMTQSRFIDKVYFMSTSDLLYPLVPPEKKSIISSYYLHSEYIEQKFGLIKPGSAYYFSGGASNRDYQFIKMLAEALPTEQFKIACLPHIADNLAPIPSNLEIFTDAYGDAFFDLVLGCKAVLLPLIDPNVMSGQIVCLRSMQAAKHIFITQNNFMVDWLNDVDQLPFITMYKDLNEILSILDNFDLETLNNNGYKAREFYFNNFSEEKFYERFVDEINSSFIKN